MKKPKKSPVEIFVSKDRMATIWFVIAVMAMGFAFWYVRDMEVKVKAKPQFFVMDGANTYYIPASMDFEDAKEVHAAQTRLAMETVFNRNPGGSDNAERMERLFGNTALDYLEDEYDKEKGAFSEQNIHQKVEVGEIKVLKTMGTQVVSSAKGQIIRVGVFEDRQFTVVYEVTARFKFVLNKDMRRNGRFPTVCTKVEYELIKKAES